MNREQSRAQTRKRLLESAREVFAARGVNGASVDWIAERAGFSKGALYSNFSSKAAIILELLRSYLEEEQEGLAMAIAQHAELSAMLAAVHQLYAYLETRMDMCLLGVEFRLYAARESAEISEVNRLFAMHERALATQFETMASRLNKGLRVPAEELVAIIMGATHGLLLQRAGQKSIRAGLVADTVVNLLGQYLNANP